MGGRKRPCVLLHHRSAAAHRRERCPDCWKGATGTPPRRKTAGSSECGRGGVGLACRRGFFRVATVDAFLWQIFSRLRAKNGASPALASRDQARCGATRFHGLPRSSKSAFWAAIAKKVAMFWPDSVPRPRASDARGRRCAGPHVRSDAITRDWRLLLRAIRKGRSVRSRPWPRAPSRRRGCACRAPRGRGR